MTAPHGYRCRACGQWHDELPFAWHLEAPAFWRRRYRLDPRSSLSSDQCVIKNAHFFVRGLIQLPVLDAEEPFAWGAWVSLSRGNFERADELWRTPGRESEPPYFGWLANEIPVYEASTLDLPTQVHTQPVGLRPLIEIAAVDHPLAAEQRDGISPARVQEFAELAQHPPFE